MNRPEKDLWDKIRVAMGLSWSAQRHEDRYSLGIPDVSFAITFKGKKINGWIELKVIGKMHDSNVIKVSKFTKEQKAWLTDTSEHGGNCFLFLKAGDVYMIFGDDFYSIGTMTAKEMLSKSIINIESPSGADIKTMITRALSFNNEILPHPEG